ncbi:MAG: hypothetical protein CMO81_03345 [Waddliaceae bacterium]|nr:hypothetical protein [Waddliaceae bacterium]
MPAWNEEDSIGLAINSLMDQTIFEHCKRLGATVDIFCIANGCTDNTVTIAEEAFDKYRSSHLYTDYFTATVYESSVPNRSHAWNDLVHTLSDKETDYYIFMDADIAFLDRDTLYQMLMELIENPEAILSADTPVKHIKRSKTKSLMNLFSISVTRVNRSAPGLITGQLYCARGSFVRRFHLPDQMIIDDGFIKWLGVTEFLTKTPTEEEITAMVRHSEGSHLFEAYTRPRDIFDNQVRQAVGNSILDFTFQYLRQCMLKDPDTKVDTILLERYRENPNWLKAEIASFVSSRTFWVLKPGLLIAPFTKLKHLTWKNRFIYLPASCLVFLANLPVLLKANWTLKNLQLGSLWKDTKNSELRDASDLEQVV